ncbi:GTP-binding protein rho4 [Podospora appendiculata]|uniref:GTP-binding protein rho4 n=1 Tax=Podospora appendiculata TaxID=314037 RepID=A0AAE0WXT4_9PEZI|nr:GTP-binding protein rho4 [Podospora appendiculata]
MSSHQRSNSYYNTQMREKYDSAGRRQLSDRRDPRGTRSSDGTVSTVMSNSTGRESSATAMTEGPAYSKKIVVVGDGGCGKTCLLISYSQGYFPETVELALWDTAGQEEYDRLRPLSYPETDLIFVCFAIDCPNSLENVMDKKSSISAPTPPLVLVGLKSDLRYKKTCIDMLKTQGLTPVTTEQGLAVSQKMGAQYMECSSKEMKGVEEIFEQAILTVVAGDRKTLELQASSGSAPPKGGASYSSGAGGASIPGIVLPKKKKRKCGML